jgi:TPR repeat protein
MATALMARSVAEALALACLPIEKDQKTETSPKEVLIASLQNALQNFVQAVAPPTKESVRNEPPVVATIMIQQQKEPNEPKEPKEPKDTKDVKVIKDMKDDVKETKDTKTASPNPSPNPSTNQEQDQEQDVIFQEALDYECGLNGKIRDFALAAMFYASLARKGHMEAQYRLAQCFYYGLGVAKNTKKALEFCNKASKQGHERALPDFVATVYDAAETQEGREKIRIEHDPALRRIASKGNVEAQHCLGHIMDTSDDKAVQKEAFFWFEKAAASAKDPYSAYRLARLYHDHKDHKKYFDLLSKLVDQQKDKNPDFEEKLGDCFRDGIGTEMNKTKAVALYQSASQAAIFAPVFLKLGRLYEQGYDAIPPNLVLAFKAYQQGADLNDAECQYQLGRCFEYGKGPQKAMKDAWHWYQQSAWQNHAAAAFEVGCFLQSGCGSVVERDETKALEWFQFAAENGNAAAQCKLGNAYEHGNVLGIQKNPVEMVKYYKMAADQGDARGQYNMAFCYRDSLGTLEKDTKKARECLVASAKQGYAAAQYNLGVDFLKKNKFGFPVHPETGVEWLKKAAAQGHENAIRQLGTKPIL